MCMLTGKGQGARGEKGARDKVTKRTRGKDGMEWGGCRVPKLGRDSFTCIFVQEPSNS